MNKALMWIASLILGVALTEGAFWCRHRINRIIQLLEVKVPNEVEMTRQYERQADALEALAVLDEARLSMQFHAFKNMERQRRKF